MKLLSKILLVLGIFLSFFLRFSNLSSHPPALFSDEVDAGYQAYVFNQCHSDYHGNPYPTHFHSFADWRTPFYLYSIALSQKILGDTDFSIRFPAALFGSLVPLALAYLIYSLTARPFVALSTLFISAINPWLFHYSRAGWEVTGMLLSVTLGLILWLKYFSTKKLINLILSIIFFASSFYFYATAKLFIILLAPCLLVIWRKEIIKLSRRNLIIALFSVLVISSPLVVDTLRGRAGFRFSYINIFQLNLYQPLVDSLRYQDSLISSTDQIGVKPSVTSIFFHNKYSLLISKFTNNYLSAFSTNYLFLTGDGHLRQGFGQRGNLLLPDFFLIGLGLIGVAVDLIKKKSPRLNQFHFLMLCILLLSPIPFSFTGDSPYPQSTRLIIMTIPLIYLITIGISFLFSIIKLPILKRFLVFFLIFVYSICFLDFTYYYNHQYPLISAKSWHVGVKETVLESLKYQNKFTQIYYSNSYESFLPFFYWYTRYLPPKSPNGTCSSAANTVWANTNFFTGMQINHRYYFGSLEWSQLLSSPELLTNQQLFAISQSDLDKINHIQPPPQVDILWQTNKKYTEQEKLYLVTFSRPN